jgi:hypothetical protein
MVKSNMGYLVRWVGAESTINARFIHSCPSWSRYLWDICRELDQITLSVPGLDRC